MKLYFFWCLSLVLAFTFFEYFTCSGGFINLCVLIFPFMLIAGSVYTLITLLLIGGLRKYKGSNIFDLPIFAATSVLFIVIALVFLNN